MTDQGPRIHWLEETDSTNLHAERLLDAGLLAGGDVVAARFQTAGMGQGDHVWESERGLNIMVTMVFEPSFLTADQQFLLNKAVTLGACDCLQALGTDPVIKWPNDLCSGERKIGGILITHRVSGMVIDSTIAGIGINLNQMVFSGHLPDAVSVRQLTGKPHDLQEAVKLLASCITLRYSALKENPGPVGDDYLKRLKGYNVWSAFLTGHGESEGRIIGVDEFGRLFVESRNKEIRAWAHGEIRQM